MSGVASIGSFVKLHTPSPTRASVSSNISHRCAMANRMIFSSMAATSVLVLGGRFLDVRLDEEALLDHDLLAGLQAGHDLDALCVAAPAPHRARDVGVAPAH